MRIAACVKWVDRRPEVDALSGRSNHDPRSFGASPADQAALAWALRLGSAWDAEVVVLTVAPPGAEVMLREALAVGAHRAVRIEVEHRALGHDGQPDSASVAACLAAVLHDRPGGVDLVVCGDWSLDRGTGSVPVFLAAELGLGAAAGLVRLEPTARGALRVERRLDRGRREVLDVVAPAVISVEAATAVLPRASLPAVLAARSAPIDRVDAGLPPSPRTVRLEHRGPYRPRARELPAPAGDDPRRRILHLVGADRDRTPPRSVVAEPEAAAAAIHEQLLAWGIVEGPAAVPDGDPTDR